MLESQSVHEALSFLATQDANPEKILGLTIGKHSNIKPGQQIPKADAQEPPQLSLSVTSGTFLAVCIDLDAPFPSFSSLGPILHWIQPGFTPSSQNGNGPANLSSGDTAFITNYIGPAPPPMSSPHRYFFLIYEQPADFDPTPFAPANGKEQGNMSRMRYDLGAFEKKAKLGPIIAANYFCSN